MNRYEVGEVPLSLRLWPLKVKIVAPYLRLRWPNLKFGMAKWRNARRVVKKKREMWRETGISSMGTCNCNGNLFG